MKPTVERRAPQPRLYSREQLLGRAPIRLRRRSDKVRFAAHVGAAAGLVGLSAWWVFPLHSFAGPVLVSLTRTHGLHAGDLATLPFLAAAGWSGVAALRLLEPARRWAE